MIFIVYDIKNLKSFSEVDSWLKTIKNNAAAYSKIFVIGNKADLEKSREVDADEAEEYAMVRMLIIIRLKT